MSREIFTDSSMLEIFRAEVETHTESLTAGLLALERDPGDTTHLNEMMRAAHSIKGAARIVGIDPAVPLAHVMEDGFVAAQQGKLTLRPAHVDVLLRGVDMLSRISARTHAETLDWSEFETEVQPLVAEISAVLQGGATPTPVSRAIGPPAPTTPAPGLSTADVTIPLPVMLDVAAAELARQALVRALDSRVPVVRLDCSATQDLDATGLALLAAAPEFFRASGTQLQLTGTSVALRAVFAATGIDRLYAAEGR